MLYIFMICIILYENLHILQTATHVVQEWKILVLVQTFNALDIYVLFSLVFSWIGSANQNLTLQIFKQQNEGSC